MVSSAAMLTLPLHQFEHCIVNQYQRYQIAFYIPVHVHVISSFHPFF